VARLYAAARSGAARATPHPPKGVAREHPAVGDARAAPCASHGDHGSPQAALAEHPHPGRYGVTVFRGTNVRARDARSLTSRVRVPSGFQPKPSAATIRVFSVVLPNPPAAALLTLPSGYRFTLSAWDVTAC